MCKKTEVSAFSLDSTRYREGSKILPCHAEMWREPCFSLCIRLCPRLSCTLHRTWGNDLIRACVHNTASVCEVSYDIPVGITQVGTVSSGHVEPRCSPGQIVVVAGAVEGAKHGTRE